MKYEMIRTDKADDHVSEDFLLQVRELGVAVETVGLKEV